MFTGLIEEIGTVQSIHPVADGLRLQIQCREILSDVTIDASICVNGVCLTVVQFGSSSFQADAVAETVARTNLKKLAPGSRVNLERALRLSDRLGGHFVQGHVDGLAVVTHRRREPQWDVVGFSLPGHVQRYVVAQGSICLDGVSLTVSARGPDGAEVSLIPETLRATTLNDVRAGSRLNVEVDVIAKYVESLLGGYR